jgi:hypothetical protein
MFYKIKFINTRESGIITVLSILLVIQTSCKKLVESPPPSDQIAETNVFSVDATAISVLNGLYTAMNGTGTDHPAQGDHSIGLLEGLAADELTLYSGTGGVQLAYYQNALSVSGHTGSEQWDPLYNFIYKCNSAVEGLNGSSSLTPKVKTQLLGEAKFFRAFCYFYLVNLFGDIPLVLGTDPQVNSLLSRTPKDQVYQQIISDLKDAQDKLSDQYLDANLQPYTSNPERLRPTKWAANALLARVYLYTDDFAKAEEQSSVVINNSTLYGPISAVPLNSVFLKNSREAIWQIQPTDINFNTQEAQAMVLLPPSTGPNTSNNPVYLSTNLLTAFETGDQRAANGNWIDSVVSNGRTYKFSYKYKINTSPGVTKPSDMKEYFMVLRLGEQYLIRAEAKAHLGESDAVDDLNAIRNRAGLPDYNGPTDQSSLLVAILHERQVELFCEWGHRWFDLKRTNNLDSIMTVVTPQKSSGSPWQSYQQWCPIALGELQKAPNLVQTPGY